MTQAYITSRPKLSTNAAEMQSEIRFNLWKRKLWPYDALAIGDTLYWYEGRAKAIRWKSRIANFREFEYTSLADAKAKLADFFALPAIEEKYLEGKPEQGFGIAFTIDELERVFLPKPESEPFPREGWLRGDSATAREWLAFQPSTNGPRSKELETAEAQVAGSGYFDELTDDRERVLREVVQRRGQPEFRRKLIEAYGGKCAVTGCDAEAALEAAHIVPYSGPESNDVTNGLLLRADIHTLFDLDLIAIDPISMKVVVATSLLGTSYEELRGRKLTLPADMAEHSSKSALLNRLRR